MDDTCWEGEIETIDRSALEKLQLDRLNETIAKAKDSDFYYGRLPQRVERLEEVETLPFTTKQDLRDCFPAGMVAVPKENLVRLHSSSGTTGYGLSGSP